VRAPEPIPDFFAARPHKPKVRLTPGHGLFRYLFVPALLAFSLVPWLTRSAAGSWALSSAARPGATAAVLLISMLLIWLAEQLYPSNADWNPRLFSDGFRGWRRGGRDSLYLFGVTQLTAFLIAAAEPELKAFAVLGHVQAIWPATAAFPLRLLLAFFAMELCSYAIHRAAHRSRLLWQFHSTHHFVTELTGLKSVRTHPVDNLLFYVCRTVPLMLVGAGSDEIVAATYFGGVLGILAHANLQISDRWLGLIFNFPQVHAVHHASDLAQSNSNFGCHTVVWDRIFGTYRRAVEPPVLGVAPVGPRSVWQELAWPFYRWVSPWTPPGTGGK
jgi:sterol desaturase/sphingolipid hydroxylase (fatty acid hydroxylase superfamily)